MVARLVTDRGAAYIIFVVQQRLRVQTLVEGVRILFGEETFERIGQHYSQLTEGIRAAGSKKNKSGCEFHFRSICDLLFEGGLL